MQIEILGLSNEYDGSLSGFSLALDYDFFLAMYVLQKKSLDICVLTRLSILFVPPRCLVDFV